MDINYFINILQQNTETIKQLNERISLLEDENKQLKSIKNEFKYLQGDISKLFDCVSPFAINTHPPLSSPVLFLPSQKSRWHNNIVQKTNYYLNLEYLIIEDFKQSSISDLQIQNNKLHTLFIFPTYSTEGTQRIVYYLNWTLDGIENISNLKKIFIYNAFGLKNVYESLLKCDLNIEIIEIYNSIHISSEEIDKIKKLCIERKIIIKFIGHHESFVSPYYISYNENEIGNLFTKDLNATIECVKQHKFVKTSRQQYNVG
jgi:hypothetical protein